MEYTLHELIAEWKMRKGLEPLRVDAAIKRQDAFEIDEYIRRMIDSRYERLLYTAPIELLEPSDITETVNIESFTGGVVVMKLPDDCCRLVEVKMNTWHRPATIVTQDSATALRQTSPFGRAGACNPVAVLQADGRLKLYSFKASDNPEPERVLAITRPAPGIYRCHPLALDSLFI